MDEKARDEEARFARTVGLSLGALWVAVVALRALTYSGPEADAGGSLDILARAGDGSFPLVQADSRGAFTHRR